jgi:hypothetical protein
MILVIKEFLDLASRSSTARQDRYLFLFNLGIAFLRHVDMNGS